MIVITVGHQKEYVQRRGPCTDCRVSVTVVVQPLNRTESDTKL